MTTVGIYTRLSKDDGTKTSTHRQEADARAYATSRGWTVGAVWTDRDRSAFNGDHRPGFEAMVAALDAGQIEGIVAWKIDRLARRTADFAGLARRAEDRGAFVVACQDGIDTSTDMGLAMAGVGSVFAELEARTIRTRTKAGLAQSAREGKPAGGGRSFGYRRVDGKLVIVRREAAALRRAAADVLAGRSLANICREWNGAKLLTPRKRPWDVTSLRRCLTSPRIAGLRQHGDERIEGTWAGIVDRETHAALVAKFVGNRGRRAPSGRYVLSGVLRCGLCGKTMGHAPGRFDTYRCTKGSGDGCGRVQIAATKVEPFVTELVVGALAGTKFGRVRARRRTSSTPKAELDLQRAEASLEQLQEARYVDGTLTEKRYRELSAALTSRIERARQAVVANQGDATLARAPSGNRADVTEAFGALDVERRNAIIRALVDRIDVGPSKVRGRGAFDPDRFAVSWRA